MLRFSQAFARKTAISFCERRASRGGWLQPVDLVAFTIGPSGRLACATGKACRPPGNSCRLPHRSGRSLRNFHHEGLSQTQRRSVNALAFPVPARHNRR